MKGLYRDEQGNSLYSRCKTPWLEEREEEEETAFHLEHRIHVRPCSPYAIQKNDNGSNDKDKDDAKTETKTEEVQTATITGKTQSSKLGQNQMWLLPKEGSSNQNKKQGSDNHDTMTMREISYDELQKQQQQQQAQAQEEEEEESLSVFSDPFDTSLEDDRELLKNKQQQTEKVKAFNKPRGFRSLFLPPRRLQQTQSLSQHQQQSKANQMTNPQQILADLPRHAKGKKQIQKSRPLSEMDTSSNENENSTNHNNKDGSIYGSIFSSTTISVHNNNNNNTEKNGNHTPVNHNHTQTNRISNKDMTNNKKNQAKNTCHQQAKHNNSNKDKENQNINTTHTKRPKPTSSTNASARTTTIKTPPRAATPNSFIQAVNAIWKPTFNTSSDRDFDSNGFGIGIGSPDRNHNDKGCGNDKQRRQNSGRNKRNKDKDNKNKDKPMSRIVSDWRAFSPPNVILEKKFSHDSLFDDLEDTQNVSDKKRNQQKQYQAQEDKYWHSDEEQTYATGWSTKSPQAAHPPNYDDDEEDVIQAMFQKLWTCTATPMTKTYRHFARTRTEEDNGTRGGHGVGKHKKRTKGPNSAGCQGPREWHDRAVNLILKAADAFSDDEGFDDDEVSWQDHHDHRRRGTHRRGRSPTKRKNVNNLTNQRYDNADQYYSDENNSLIAR